MSQSGVIRTPRTCGARATSRRKKFHALCVRLGLTRTHHSETRLHSPFEKYFLEDISLPPAAAVFAPLENKAVEKAAKKNHRRGVILLREDKQRVLAVHAPGVVEGYVLSAHGTPTPYIQHRSLACSVLEHRAVLQRVHRWLLARSMGKRISIPPEFCNEIVTGSDAFYSYGLLILGNRVSVLLEEGLAKFSKELRHLALVKLVARIVGERTAGEPVEVRLWRRRGKEIIDLDYMGKETDAFLAKAASP